MKINVGTRELELTEAEARELHSRLMSLFGLPAVVVYPPAVPAPYPYPVTTPWPNPWPSYPVITCGGVTSLGTSLPLS